MRLFHILFGFAIVTGLFVSCTASDTSTETSEYVYGDTALYGPNLLYVDATEWSGVDFSLQAFVPADGQLIIKVTKLTGSYWSVIDSSASNWAVSEFDYINQTQTFTAIENDHDSECHVEIPYGTYRIDYYEEGDSTPSQTKELAIN